ncbi:glycoside hydrolase family 3 protein [Gammaproteobacteria bacterium]|nr:glycoside hydrolase family 3 protein [Gammaproteobacteria bacterium]MDC0914021.1 glycoside hydrolase family 3 protein [Gammaproteobacteria bacterium]
MTNIDQIIKTLTLDEKVSLLSGFNSWYTNKIEKKNIPSIKMSDGPNGVRGDSNSGKSSACFPCAISIGSTWDLSLIKDIGVALGEEAQAKDVDVLLGPTINIHRHPLGGRHFESFSEDPFLTGKIATNYVQGVQSKNVAACLKHFVGNDTEYERHSISSNIDAQTLREIYLLPFEMGIKEGNAKVVMSAYNKLNNIFCSSHQDLLIKILKEEWGFDGYVVSDWGAALETIENANGGLDLEMPGPSNVWGKALIDAVEASEVSEKLIDDKVKRILTVAEFSNRFQKPQIKAEQAIDQPKHRLLLRKAAADGMVLLKNEGSLPLKKNIKKLAVIGPNALEAQIIGGGSASLRPHYQIHPLEAVQERLGHETEILYSKGCHTHKYLPKINEELMEEKDGFLVEYFDGNQFGKNLILEERLTGSKFWVFEGFAKDVISKEERPDISVRFSCTYKPDISGLHEFEIFGIGKCRLLIDGNELIDNWTSMDPGEAFFTFGSASKKGVTNLQKGEAYKIEVQYKFEGSFPAVYIGCQAPDEVDIFQEALETASHADDVILIVGTNSDWETEGNDRADFNLPANQNKLIEAILEANQNTVVVINTGSPIHMPWEKKAKAIIQTWFAGQEFGNALVDILSGEVNPSGKLATTFPVKIEDTPAYKNYPGKNLQMNYDEKLLVGHRWYESNSIKPLFCFGHGLSFTSFNYQNLEVTTGSDFVVTCKFEIQNTGDISGLEIAQCYVGFASPLPGEPYKTLQGFVKEEIGANELKKVEIKLGPRNFSFWSVETNTWQIREGSYQILIGSSSENILLQANINLEQALEVR